MPRAAVGAPGVARDDPAMTVIPTTHSAWPVVTVPRSSSWVSAAWCCAASSACSATNDHLAVQNGRRLPAVPTPDWRNSADERASQGPQRSTPLRVAHQDRVSTCVQIAFGELELRQRYDAVDRFELVARKVATEPRRAEFAGKNSM
jgi:hypothetical protein